MKRLALIVFTTILFAILAPAQAWQKTEMMKIEKIGPQKSSRCIKVNGKKLRTGDTFRASDVIVWPKGVEYVKARRIANPKKTYVITRKNAKGKSFYDEFDRIKPAGVKGGNNFSDSEIASMKALVKSPVYMIGDTLRLYSFLPVNDDCYYFVQAQDLGSYIKIPLSYDPENEYCAILTKGDIVAALEQDGIPFPKSPLKLTLFYRYKDEYGNSGQLPITDMGQYMILQFIKE